MTEPIHLAFLWHQHQPFYKDTLSDRIEMPWVRLHAIKDYYGMAAMIERHPGIKATVNFVPSLLVQLQDQIDGKQDIWQSLSRIAPSDMNYDQRRFLLQNFFMTNPNTMIRPLPRYFELYGRRSGVDIDEKVVARFSDEEIRDIQALSNLAWFHPITLEDDVFLGEMYKRGQHFSEEEKQQILDKQIEVMKQVIPLHRKLQDEGRLELSTTPFYHPIIPLLLDEHSVHEAMPDARLPRRTLPLAGDAYEQVRRAYQYHTEVFGKAPAGMWPSEGSVSQEAAELFASAGAKWIATDEEILARSTGVQKSAQRHPYRPYRVNGVPGSLSIVFRDHVVSDLMSFQYQYFNEDDAVSDFLEKIRDIGKRHSERPLCVFVILDGENAWEHYRRTAYPFFVKLYEKLEEADDIVLTRISEYIENHEPTHSIDRVAAGSWINGDFAIWAGHDEDIEAWEYIDRVREDLRIMTQSSHGKYNSADVKNAWEEIYIAEGSDYFWWYGEDHSSVQDMEFDALFRMHLKNVYRHLGEGYPEFLDEPIKKRGQRKLYSEPTALLRVKLDGEVSSYFEWHFAAHYDSSADYGSMARVSSMRLQDVYFGFDDSNLLLRVDVSDQARETEDLQVVLTVRKPVRMDLVFDVGSQEKEFTCRNNGRDGDKVGSVCLGRIFEARIPLEELDAQIGMVVEFQIQLEADGKIVEILPRGGVFNEPVPPIDYDHRNWGL